MEVMLESKMSAQPRPELIQARKGLVEKRLKHALKGTGGSNSIPHRPQAPTAPLSFAQQRLWFIDQLEPGSPAYHVATALRLRGPLDSSALERSIGEIVKRHEILRTRFPAVDGMPIQVIDVAECITLPLFDFTQISAEEREPR